MNDSDCLFATKSTLTSFQNTFSLSEILTFACEPPTLFARKQSCTVRSYHNLPIVKMMLHSKKVSTKAMIASVRSIGSKRCFTLFGSATTRKPPSVTPQMAIRHSNRHTLPVSTLLRYKSSAAVSQVPDDTEEITGHSEGHAAAAEARNKFDTSHEEAWMINLGRGSNNQWLTGPRSDEWFTGLPPSQCPGKYKYYWPEHVDHLYQSYGGFHARLASNISSNNLSIFLWSQLEQELMKMEPSARFHCLT